MSTHDDYEAIINLCREIINDAKIAMCCSEDKLSLLSRSIDEMADTKPIPPFVNRRFIMCCLLGFVLNNVDFTVLDANTSIDQLMNSFDSFDEMLNSSNVNRSLLEEHAAIVEEFVVATLWTVREDVGKRGELFIKLSERLNAVNNNYDASNYTAIKHQNFIKRWFVHADELFRTWDIEDNTNNVEFDNVTNDHDNMEVQGYSESDSSNIMRDVSNNNYDDVRPPPMQNFPLLTEESIYHLFETRRSKFTSEQRKAEWKDIKRGKSIAIKNFNATFVKKKLIKSTSALDKKMLGNDPLDSIHPKTTINHGNIIVNSSHGEKVSQMSSSEDDFL